jgi:phosphoglycerate kinase
MQLKSFENLDLNNKTAIIRVDFNVPIKNNEVTELTRIKTAKPTIDLVKKLGGKVVLLAHLGRPEAGKYEAELSLKQIISAIESSLNYKVDFINYDQELASETIKNSGNSPESIILIENIRFFEGEETNSPEFSQRLAQLGDIYINDAFGVSHRKHASTFGICQYLPSYAGLLLQAEITAMEKIRQGQIKKPLTVIVGGAKIDTKIGILNDYAERADNLIIGGALANTFLLAQGYEIGKSKVELEKVAVAQQIMETAKANNVNLILPTDTIIAETISETSNTEIAKVENLNENAIILDLGPETIEKIKKTISTSGTIIWNGPMGFFELTPFASGTKALINAISETTAETYIGGGDSLDAMNKFGFSDFSKFTHVSTGGGAMIDYLQGEAMPAVEILRN